MPIGRKPFKKLILKKIRERQKEVREMVEKNITIYPNPSIVPPPNAVWDPVRGEYTDNLYPEGIVNKGEPFFIKASVRWVSGMSQVRESLGEVETGDVRFYTKASYRRYLETAEKIIIDDKEIEVLKNANGAFDVKPVRGIDGSISRIVCRGKIKR